MSPLMTGYQLKGFCQAARYRALRLYSEKSEEVDSYRRFMELYGGEWKLYANNAKAVNSSRQGKKPEALPLEEDIRIFNYCLIEIICLVKKI